MAWFRSSQPQQSKISQPVTAAVTAPPAPAPASAPPAAPAQRSGTAAGAATATPPARRPGETLHGAPARRPGETLHGAPAHGGRALPVLGYPEAYYLKHCHEADERGDNVAHDCYKVGQYVTLGLDHKESPERKAKYFGHALRRHAQPPADADAHVRDFYQRLADLVRKSAGGEIVRLAKRENELLQKRMAGGTNREILAAEFAELLKKATADQAHHCPDWISHEHWEQIRAVRSHWS